ncbi:unnamed protein product [Ectocarpus fasciculatus]
MWTYIVLHRVGHTHRTRCERLSPNTAALVLKCLPLAMSECGRTVWSRVLHTIVYMVDPEPRTAVPGATDEQEEGERETGSGCPFAATVADLMRMRMTLLSCCCGRPGLLLGVETDGRQEATKRSQRTVDCIHCSSAWNLACPLWYAARGILA